MAGNGHPASSSLWMQGVESLFISSLVWALLLLWLHSVYHQIQILLGYFVLRLEVCWVFWSPHSCSRLSFRPFLCNSTRALMLASLLVAEEKWWSGVLFCLSCLSLKQALWFGASLLELGILRDPVPSLG
jgi:hypothetical protein